MKQCVEVTLNELKAREAADPTGADANYYHYAVREGAERLYFYDGKLVGDDVTRAPVATHGPNDSPVFEPAHETRFDPVAYAEARHRELTGIPG